MKSWFKFKPMHIWSPHSIHKWLGKHIQEPFILQIGVSNLWWPSFKKEASRWRVLQKFREGRDSSAEAVMCEGGGKKLILKKIGRIQKGRKKWLWWTESQSKNSCKQRLYNVHSKCSQEKDHSGLSKELMCKFSERGARNLGGSKNVRTSQNI